MGGQPHEAQAVAQQQVGALPVGPEGGVSLQRTLPFGTVEEVRQEVEALIRTCGYNGGLVVFPSNVIQPDTPVENIIACFHAARDFDLASLDGPPG